MRFSISKNIFLAGLTKIQGIVEKRHTIPILANVLIEAKNGEIIMTATDLEVGLRSRYKANIGEEGKVTVSAKKLYEIIKELPDQEINFLTKNNFWVEIKCGKSLFNLVGLSPEEFPKFPDYTMEKNRIDKDNLLEMIDKTLFSVSNDETKFNLTGIFIKSESTDDATNLVFVSTDGHRLSLIQRKIEENIDSKYSEGFILPRKGIIEIKKLLENIEKDVLISVHDNNFIVNNEDTTLVMRMVDGEFPDYKRVIPEKGENVAVINRELFLHALKRISILSSEKSKGIKINFQNDRLILSSSNPDLGDATEEIDMTYGGHDISIGFNAKYIIDILQVIKTENVVFYLKNDISPGRISPEDDEDHLSVIMPMRL